MTRSHQWRVVWVVIVLMLGLSRLSMRLVKVQVTEHELHLAKAQDIHAFRRAMPARRGDIVDCRDNLLATTVPLKRVMADLYKMRQILERNRDLVAKKKVSRITKPEQIAEALSPILGIAPATLAERLRWRADLVVLAPKVDIESWRKIQAMRLPGIQAADGFQRVYPLGCLGSHLVGYVDAENVGRGGIEATMQHYLCGVDGWYQSLKDALDREIRVYRDQDAPPKHGLTVVLTVDQTVQLIVEEELEAAVAMHSAKGACAIVMRPSTGEILAMANRPTFDANVIGASDWDTIRNRCVTDCFEPGSTFKMVTLSALIECGRARLDTTVYCENGRWTYEGTALDDPGQYGNLTVLQAMQKSSSIGFAKLGLQMGPDRLHRFAEGFGFGSTVLDGILPGEATGRLAKPERWSKLSVTRVPIGYEVAVTPLQLAAAVSAVANRGVWMRPLLVREVRDARGVPVARYVPKAVRQVVSSETADRVIDALEAVVSEHGTGKRAQVDGFISGGKTGTSLKWDAKRQEYNERRYLASFAGMVPSREAAFTLVVMIDEPQGDVHSGGLVAAPVFSAMASRIARHLDVEPARQPLEVVRR